MKSRRIYIFLILLTLLAICIGIDIGRNYKIYSQGEDMLQCRNSELLSYTKDVFINGEKINIDLVILNAYSSTLYNNNAYKFISKNDQILSNRINKDTLIYTSEIIKLNDKYKCINIKDVNWICLPLESIEEFNSMFAI